MSFRHASPRREMSQGRGTAGPTGQPEIQAVIFSFLESCHSTVISCEMKLFGEAFCF